MIELVQGKLPPAYWDRVIAQPGTEISDKLLALILFMQTIDDPDCIWLARKNMAYLDTFTRKTRIGKAYTLMLEMSDMLHRVTRKLESMAPAGCHLVEWQGLIVYMPD